MYKPSYDQAIKPRRPVLMMRLSFLVMLFCSSLPLMTHASSYSQQITYQKKSDLKHLLRELQQQSGMNVIWNELDLKGLEKVQYSFKETPLQETLDVIFKNSALEYTMLDNTIIVKKRKGAAPLMPISTAHPVIQEDVVAGVVYERDHEGALIPLRHSTISIARFGMVTASNAAGEFEFRNVPPGELILNVQHLGMVMKDTTIRTTDASSRNLRIVMESMTFKILDVDVIARRPIDAVGSISSISRTAIEHLQANSLSDVMSLIPGSTTTNPDLTGAKQINIRAVAGDLSNANAFGTSIIVDGVPLSNNANLQAMSSATGGDIKSLSGGAAPNGGYDTRSIPTHNVERIDVIRGVPGVQYGDIASGVVIVHQKAGKQDLYVEANTNPNLYSFTALRGFELGSQGGALNIDLNYAHNTDDPVQSYLYYQRIGANGLYSNSFFNNKLQSTTSLRFSYGKNTQEINPDDLITFTESSGQDVGTTFSSRGVYSVTDRWLKNVEYMASASYTVKDAFFQRQYTSANAPYGMTMVDGAVLSGRPGFSIFDEDGAALTQIPAGEEHLQAIFLPSTYLGQYRIDGKEFNSFVKVVGNFFNRIGQTDNKWLIGADFKTDQNFGDGKTFSDSLPPYRNLQYPNASFRKRMFKDIPALNQFGLFVQEDFSTMLGKNRLNIIAGLRYDFYSGNKSVLSPRVNVLLDVVPDVLQVRGGYGLLAKAPSLMYLFPEDAYFDYININELASSIPAAEQNFMTTTRVFSTENSDLKISQNEKKEVGFDLRFGFGALSLTAFEENLKNGYGIGETVSSFMPVQYDEYRRVPGSAYYALYESNPTLAKFTMPHNNLRLDKKGIEMELNFNRIDAIRTEFSMNGALIAQQSYSADYTYFDDFSETSGAGRTHIGLYEKGMVVANSQSLVTSLRAVHNIPDIGFVISLTTDFIWSEFGWDSFGNDSIPVKYISKFDGEVRDFDPNRMTEPEFQSLLRPINRITETKETNPLLVNFNINVTKEIKDFVKVSFFANNMFRYYQIVQSDRVKSNYRQRNIPFYFGLKVGVKL